MSDWFGTYSTAEALRAGLDLEMPGPSMLRGTPLLRYLAGNKIRESELTPRLKKVRPVNRAPADHAGITYNHVVDSWRRQYCHRFEN